MTKTQIILWWFLPIIVMAVINWYLIVKLNRHPKYRLHDAIKGAVGLGFLALAHFDLWFIPYAFMSYWTIFDPLLNILRGKNIGYVGTAKDSAKTDNFEIEVIEKLSLPMAGLMFLKFVLSFLLMSIYYTGWRGFIEQVNGTYDWDKWLW